jgi:hypothetical protein
VEEFLKSIFSSILSWERDRSRVSTNAFKSAILRRFVPPVLVLELLFIPLWLLCPPMLQQLLLLLISCSLRSVCSVGLDPVDGCHPNRRYVMCWDILSTGTRYKGARWAYFYDNTCWIMSALIEIVDGFATVRSLFCFCFVTGRAEGDLYFGDGKWTTPFALRAPGTHFFTDFLQPARNWITKLNLKKKKQYFKLFFLRILISTFTGKKGIEGPNGHPLRTSAEWKGNGRRRHQEK